MLKSRFCQLEKKTPEMVCHWRALGALQHHKRHRVAPRYAKWEKAVGKHCELVGHFGSRLAHQQRLGMLLGGHWLLFFTFLDFMHHLMKRMSSCFYAKFVEQLVGVPTSVGYNGDGNYWWHDWKNYGSKVS